MSKMQSCTRRSSGVWNYLNKEEDQLRKLEHGDNKERSLVQAEFAQVDMVLGSSDEVDKLAKLSLVGYLIKPFSCE